MKKIIQNLIIILIIIFSSCDTDSFLDEKFSPETPWQSVDQLEMAAAQPYAGFFRTWTCPWGTYSFYDMLATDLGSLIPGQTGNFPWNEFYNRKHRETTLESASAGWINDAYGRSYISILACNDALNFLKEGEKKGIDLFPKDPKTYEDENIPRIKSELLFWRGFAYYFLALYFTPPYNPEGDNSDQILPLKTSPINPQNTKIGTTQEVWDQIISDLKMAKSLMPKDWHVPGRVDYYTICGALARAHFYMGNYIEAENECNEIIGSNNYYLQEDVMAAWNSAPGDPEAPEVIWNINPNSKGAGVLKTFSAISRAHYNSKNGSRGTDFKQCSWVLPILSNSVLKKIDWMVDPENGDYTATALATSDKRHGTTWLRLEEYTKKEDLPDIDIADYYDTYESNLSSLDFPHVYLDKYFRGEKGTMTRYPIMRVAEFYLMRSAIRFKNSDSNGAAADLNIVRDRAGLPDISGGEITTEDIDREWIIELGGEGSYLPYLIALRKPIPPGDRNISPVQPPYASWYWHIPVAEVNLNGGYDGFDPNAN